MIAIKERYLQWLWRCLGYDLGLHWRIDVQSALPAMIRIRI